MRNYMYEKLKDHIGHNIVCVAYGDIDSPVDICIECEDCGCVLVSAEDFDKEKYCNYNNEIECNEKNCDECPIYFMSQNREEFEKWKERIEKKYNFERKI